MDAAWDLDKATVTWTVTSGSAELATFDPSVGTTIPPVTPVLPISDHTGQSLISFDVWPEKHHDPALPHVRRSVAVQAELSALVKWDPTTLAVAIISFIMGGPEAAAVAAGPGAIEQAVTNLIKKGATTSFDVEYCVPARRLQVRFQYQSTGHIDQIVFINATGTEVRHVEFEGELLEQQDGTFAGQLTVTCTVDVDGHLGDIPIKAGYTGVQTFKATATPAYPDQPATIGTTRPDHDDDPQPPTRLTFVLGLDTPGFFTASYGDMMGLQDVDGVPTVPDLAELIGAEELINAPDTDPGGPETTEQDSAGGGWFAGVGMDAADEFMFETNWLPPTSSPTPPNPPPPTPATPPAP
jgi:hypothetical protein